MIWSHNDTWMLTADHGGFVKYWQSNMNNVKMYQAHKDPIRGLRWELPKSAKNCRNRRCSCCIAKRFNVAENGCRRIVALVTLFVVVEYARFFALFGTRSCLLIYFCTLVTYISCAERFIRLADVDFSVLEFLSA